MRALTLLREYLRDKAELIKVWFEELGQNMLKLGALGFWLTIDVWSCVVMLTDNRFPVRWVAFWGAFIYPSVSIILYALWRDYQEFTETVIYAVCESCPYSGVCPCVFQDDALTCLVKGYIMEKKQNE